MLPLKDYSGATMGNLPIGQGIAVTPMQMAAALRRDRQRRHPAPAAHRRLGRRQDATKPAGQRVISEATAASVRKMLEGVVGPGGTASGAEIPGYTSRARPARPRRRSTASTPRTSTSRRSSASRPPSKPKLLVAVIVDEPNGEIYGGQVAAPAWKRDRQLRAGLPEDRARIRLAAMAVETHADVFNQSVPFEDVDLLAAGCGAARGAGARGRGVGARARARGRAASRRRRRRRRTGAAPSATSRGWSPTTASATGSTRSSSTRRWHWLLDGAVARADPRAAVGRSAARARTSRARRWSSSGRTPTPA